LSFAIFKRTEIRNLVQRYSERQDLVAVAGAGASVEVNLPTWEQLADRALRKAASYARLDLSGAALDEWVRETVRVESLLGGMAIADALSQGNLTSWLPGLLYGRSGVKGYRPGPISRQLAYMKETFEDQLDIITTNYDDLLEVALRDRFERRGISLPVITYTGPPNNTVGEHVKVIHPHGCLGRDKRGHSRTYGDIILTEQDYHGLQRGGTWQETYVGSKIMSKRCLFVGASLTDSNLLRYIYYYSKRPHKRDHHAAIIVRQPDMQLPEKVRVARERATRTRWEDRGVEAIFLDHFADVAYLIHEIAYRREIGSGYKSLDIRAKRWLREIEDKLICPTKPNKFRSSQLALNEVLCGALDAALKGAEKVGVPVKNDHLAMSLWLASPDGAKITCWASTDRVNYDPRTLAPVPLDVTSRWVSVKTMCRGGHCVDRPGGDSRWPYILGLPLDITPPGQGILPVGCLTITSMREENETILTTMPADVQSEFKRTARRAVASALESAV
jgi:hypothetical protein